ncbi:MAG: c-type cytochrome [Roseovarius sp.]|nr:c-type cytochrome [Roseovarius sp.]
MHKTILTCVLPLMSLASGSLAGETGPRLQGDGVVIDGTLFTAEEIDEGSQIFMRRCSQCHGLDHTNYRAPWLNGILGRPSASVADWAYSEPFRAWGGTWTIENLRAWLTRPQDFIPGTAMNFGGFRRRAEDRDKVIAYLVSHALAEDQATQTDN